ncbi:MAG: hypothetical protein CHACPFDD_00174 [Phycisphaerae bacterium]|nr:hypothetical protein [Phycisphaerae bacterium]
MCFVECVRKRLHVLMLLAALSASAAAQTVTVDLALDDFTDFGGAQTVADLPGPDGHITLREAVLAANNTPGPQTIAFAIPLSEWSNIFYTDRVIIRLDLMCYVSGDDTTFDFTTQTAFTGDTNPTGGEVGLQYAGVPSYIPCLWIAGNRCTVRGLDVAFGNNFSQTIWITGNNNRITGCTTNGLTIRGDYGGGSGNVVGGVNSGEGNTFSEPVGLYSHANDNLIVGNTFRWGLQITGDTHWGTCDNNRIGGPTDAERNNLAGKGYYSEEGVPTGTQLSIEHASNTRIENNYVGTTPDGSDKLPGKSGVGGIAIGIGADGTTVRNNLVSGIAMTGINHVAGQRFGIAIGVGATATATTIVGNRVGVSADGSTPILNVEGIVVSSDPNGIPSNTQIGGTEAGDGNLVANSEFGGVRLSGGTNGVRVTGNAILDNGGLGIDLTANGLAGVTPNDPGDADTGPNSLQNFPVLTSAVTSGSSIVISGTLNSLPSRSYQLEFFANIACDPSGHGEGAAFLGFAQIVTDAAGDATFAVSLTGGAVAGAAVTATATDPGGSTSEFSACVIATGGGFAPGDMNCDGSVNGFDVDGFVLALSDPVEYDVQYPDCDMSHGDVNADGSVNGFDVDGFVALLGG